MGRNPQPHPAWVRPENRFRAYVVESRCMPLGKIKKLVADKGFGFIQTDSGTDIFFHHSTVADQGFDSLSEGQQVEYTVEQGQSSKGKGPRAGSVTPA
jgi:CspA family cold shock protein